LLMTQGVAPKSFSESKTGLACVLNIELVVLELGLLPVFQSSSHFNIHVHNRKFVNIA
jgi:hypothetical protein